MELLEKIIWRAMMNSFTIMFISLFLLRCDFDLRKFLESFVKMLAVTIVILFIIDIFVIGAKP